jgi:hypothetical protein
MAAMRVPRGVGARWPGKAGWLGRRSLVRLLAASLALAPIVVTSPAASRELTPILVKTADPPIFLWSPAADGAWFGWTRYSDSTRSQNYFVQQDGGHRIRVNAKGTNGDGGGIYRRTLVYTQTRAGRFPPQFGDLYRFNLRHWPTRPAPRQGEHSSG